MDRENKKYKNIEELKTISKSDIFILISSLGITAFYLMFLVWLLKEMVEPTLWHKIFFGFMAIMSSLGIFIITAHTLNLAINKKTKNG